MIIHNGELHDSSQGPRERTDLGCAVRAEFHDQKSTGLEPSSGLAKNGLDEFKTVCTAMKSRSGLVVLHITIQDRVLGFRDVGRIRADDVEDSQVRVGQSFEQRTQTKFKLLIETVAAGISPGQLEGLPDDIGRGHEEWSFGTRFQALNRYGGVGSGVRRHRFRDDGLAFEIEHHFIGLILSRCGVLIGSGTLRGSLGDGAGAQRQNRSRQADRDTATSGAEIEDSPRTREPLRLDLVKGEFDQPFGTGTRNERAGRHFELSTVEWPRTHQVLDRFMLRRPPHQRSQGPQIIFGENSIRFHIQTQAFAAQNVPEQKLGADSGRIDIVGLQETSDPVQQLAGRPIGLP